MTALSAAQGILLYLLLGWKLIHLARAPRNVPLRCVAVCLACAAAGFALGLPVASVTSPAGRWLVFADFSLVLATSCALDCFFLFSLLSGPAARQRAVRRGFTLAAAVTMMAVAVAMTAPRASIRDLAVPAVAVFYLVFEVANGGFLADAWRWTRRGIAGADPVLARGLRVTSAGLVLMLAALIPLATVVIVRWARLPSPPALMTAGELIAIPGILVFLVGVTYPGAVMRVSAMRMWGRHRRLYRQLAPLWSELHRAFPEDALTRVPSSAWRDAVSLWGVHRRYYRRVIECRDGLVRVSPRLGTSTGREPLADRLLAALQTTTTAAPAEAVAVAVPATAGLDADAQELAVLARQVGLARRAQESRKAAGISQLREKTL
jgi:hypothetical protein